MRTHRVMGDGAQVMRLFRRLPVERIKQIFAHLEKHDHELGAQRDRDLRDD